MLTICPHSFICFVLSKVLPLRLFSYNYKFIKVGKDHLDYLAQPSTNNYHTH